MTQEERMKDIKEVIKKKVDSFDTIGIIAEYYGQMVGCVDCTFQFTCDKHRPCYQTIIKYIKTGEVL